MGIDPVTGGIIASGVGAAVGGLFGSSDNKQKTESTSTSEPWKAQQPYLKYGLQDTAYQYAKARGTPYFGGDLYANLDPRSLAGIEGMYGYAGGAGADAASRISGLAPGLLTGANGLTSSASRLLGFNPEDPTGANIEAARRYADNPAMSGIIDAASRDVVRNLNEEALPALNRSASSGGNINSNKTAITEGILRRGAADRVADISAGLRGDAYAQGLGLAEQARTANQSDWLNSLVQGGSLADRGLARGLDATTQGRTLAGLNFDDMIRAGGLYQADKQGDLTEAFDKWQGQDTRAWDLLNRYWNLVGSGNWGGATSGSTTTPTSIGGVQGALQGALGGASAGAGLYGSFSNLFGSNASAPAPYSGATFGAAYSPYNYYGGAR
jgi:hypothetical protein